MKAIGGIALLPLLTAALLAEAAPSAPPEFPHHRPADWINSDPLTLAALKGKVVLVDFWAFECVNCLNSLPWLKSVEQDKAAAGLVVIGVHTPELPEEKSPDAVRSAVQRLDIHNPVMIDGDYSYWNALRVRYWPTFCFIGRDGLLYSCVHGEVHVGDERAQQLGDAIDLLLKAPAPPAK
jgi:thiol-disulfide isomerase/thioredoxin